MKKCRKTSERDRQSQEWIFFKFVYNMFLSALFQPLCDGTHRSPFLQIKLHPVKFTVTEDKEYWLCNCKQTANRPFCDGTHKREDIQAAIK